MKYILLLGSFLCATVFCNAQTQTQYNSSEILQGIEKLKVVGSVLYVAAHPDDENTRLLGYWANEAKLRTAYLSLTRGDGGQNLIGKEQGEMLGLIRTNELLAARKTDHAEQFFTRANDFGFSKNPEETFKIWNKDSVLADVVWVIRNLKPDVIVCRFPTTGEGGHGHHTASAILAEEAFAAAADPAKFPEQLKYVQVWQVKSLFWNTFNFGGQNMTAPDQLQLDAGPFNPLLGKYYGEIASESRSMHKSQGFGTARSRGTAIEYFKQLKGEKVKQGLFENINQTWARFKETAKLESQINNCIKKYDPKAPQNSLMALKSIYKSLEAITSTNTDVIYWKNVKLNETQELILACAGFWAEAYSADFVGIPGKETEFTAQVLSKNNTPIKLNAISFQAQQVKLDSALKSNELGVFKKKMTLDNSLSYSNPYWLKEKHDIGLYYVPDLLQRGQPLNRPSVKVSYDVTIAGLSFTIERPVVYKYVDPVKGEVYRPFEVLPPVTVNISEKVFVFSDQKAKTVQLVVKANTANVSGTVELKAPEGWDVQIRNPQFTLANEDDQAIVEVLVSPKAGVASQNGKLAASVKVGNEIYTKAIQRLEYDHIPYQFMLSDAEAGIVFVELKKAGLNIGYIPGAGDEIPACLKQIGYQVTTLTDDLLTNGDLAQYGAIVTGIRAYNTSERLQVHYAKLMDYVQKGGNLVVQYNTNNRLGPVLAKIGPYPFTISRNRVTDDNAEVTFIKEEHPILNYPNKITQNDFANWVQERGIYFATDVDSHYESIFRMNDPNETPNDGSLITAKYGKGNFVYTGLVFFRELPAGVPGAYRLFTNLLSIPQNTDK